jgi:hypothetical protein
MVALKIITELVFKTPHYLKEEAKKPTSEYSVANYT